jgi:purine-binding chemotaxis protein CheW
VSSQLGRPDSEQKIRLQKLLNSVQPELLVSAPVEVEVEVEVVAEIEVQVEVAVEAEIQVEAAPKRQFAPDPKEIQDWVIEPVSVCAALPHGAARLDSQPRAAVAAPSAVQHQQIPALAWMPNGLPQWAQSRFEVLLFSVAGLTLAVPLICLGQIQPITAELTPLFGQADWFMGLQPTPQGKIRTVNTAKFVMPERYQEDFEKTAKFVISINGVPWGLAVDSVNQPISLNPDEVKWRQERSKRPWLAGTVKQHMCALLDIAMIGEMLTHADKNARKSRP